MNEKFSHSIQISLKFVPDGPSDHVSGSVGFCSGNGLVLNRQQAIESNLRLLGWSQLSDPSDLPCSIAVGLIEGIITSSGEDYCHNARGCVWNRKSNP